MGVEHGVEIGAEHGVQGIRRSTIFKKGSWKRVPNNNQIVFMHYIQNLQKNCQKLYIGYSKASYILLHKNGGKIVQFEFGEF